MPIRLFPFIEYLHVSAAHDGVPLRNLALNVRPHRSPAESGAVQEVTEIGLGFMDGGNEDFSPALGTRFHNAVPLCQILQAFSQGLPAIEGLGNLIGIHTRKLEECMGANRE